MITATTGLPHSRVLAETLHIEVVKRVCDLLGGEEPLAERLGVSLAMVCAWLTGKVAPSPGVFFIVLVLGENGSDEPRRKAAPPDSPAFTEAEAKLPRALDVLAR